MKYLSLFTIALLCCNATISAQRPSLYDLSSSPFAADLAYEVGDLLTIVVDEQADAEDKGKTDTKLEDTKFGSMLSNFLKTYVHPTGRLGKVIFPKDAQGNPTDVNERNTVKGEATNENTHKFTTSLQARVIEVVAPGQLLVRGTRSININGKTKEIFISGVIRQRDIGKNKNQNGKEINNSIRSELLADAQIEIDGEVVSKDLQPGFLGKLLRKLF